MPQGVNGAPLTKKGGISKDVVKKKIVKEVGKILKFASHKVHQKGAFPWIDPSPKFRIIDHSSPLTCKSFDHYSEI
ncbi:hypothetical protein LZK77_17145 [Rhizobium leguminosarum]|nr:hypothetical protein LZK77_17145 [Rhizobium leguminosarum]